MSTPTQRWRWQWLRHQHLAPLALAAAPAALLAVLLAMGACAGHQEPQPQAPRRFTPPDGVRRLAHQQVRMRDGVRLNADVYLPAARGGPWPAVLIRTPYADELNSNPALAQRLLAEGYAVVQQHERGRHLSEGQAAMLSYAGPDGWDTLDWISAQTWSNGKVATLGCSSSAENQLKLATLAHPAHKAMIAYSAGVGVAQAGPFREQGNFWRGGVWQQGWFNYFVEETQKDWPQLPAGLSDGQRQRALQAFKTDNHAQPVSAEAYDAVRMHLPMIDMAQALGAPRTDFEEYLARGPVHPAWAEDRVTETDRIRVPGLWAEALYDISARQTVAFFEKTRAENPAGSQALLITNGQHCAYGRETQQRIGDRPIGDARYDYLARTMAWLDRWLKDRPDSAALPSSAISVYMAGANRWVDFDAVPWAGRDASRVYWLDSRGSANTLNGDGALRDAAPADAGSDHYRYDPADPVISHGGEISGVGSDQQNTDGAFDQRALEARADVLVYTSKPLAADLAVFGYAQTELFVSSDAPDTDFTVKLVDVAPDGMAWNLADSILRMRYREGTDHAVFMRPDQTYRISPPPMLLANVFRKGHRVRLEVSSSNFPNYARSLNTADDPYTSNGFRVAQNTVHHGSEAASRLVLPVVALPH